MAQTRTGHCPNCGAPLQDAGLTKCPYCAEVLPPLPEDPATRQAEIDAEASAIASRIAADLQKQQAAAATVSAASAQPTGRVSGALYSCLGLLVILAVIGTITGFLPRVIEYVTDKRVTSCTPQPCATHDNISLYVTGVNPNLPLAPGAKAGPTPKVGITIKFRNVSSQNHWHVDMSTMTLGKVGGTVSAADGLRRDVNIVGCTTPSPIGADLPPGGELVPQQLCFDAPALATPADQWVLYWKPYLTGTPEKIVLPR